MLQYTRAAEKTYVNNFYKEYLIDESDKCVHFYELKMQSSLLFIMLSIRLDTWHTKFSVSQLGRMYKRYKPNKLLATCVHTMENSTADLMGISHI